MKLSKSQNFKLLLFILNGLVVIGLVLGYRYVDLKSSNVAVDASSSLIFPRDFGPHPNYKSEWWYINLIVNTEGADGNGKDLGYVISFSRIDSNTGLLTSRFDNEDKSFKENTYTGGKLGAWLRDSKYLGVNYTTDNTFLQLKEQNIGSDRKRIYRLTGNTKEIGKFNLVLKERTVVENGYNSPLLWGEGNGDCKGKISVFRKDDTFYYSIPDLDVTGTITDVDGVSRSVKAGKAWMDHQWFNSTPPSDWEGHYWASLHMTDSGDIYGDEPHQAIGFVTQIYESGPKYTYWVRRSENGMNSCGKGGDIRINGYFPNRYPSGWSFRLKRSENSNYFFIATGWPFSNNQIFSPPIGPSFYEPVTNYAINMWGKSYKGLGFFETHLKK